MRVDKAGHDRFPTEIDQLALLPSHTSNLVVAADGQNAPGIQVNRHRLRARLPGIHRVEIAV